MNLPSQNELYLDKSPIDDAWLAIDPDLHKKATTSQVFPFASGMYDLVLFAVGENDGRSEFRILIDGREVGRFKCRLSQEMFEEGKAYNKLWENTSTKKGPTHHHREQGGKRRRPGIQPGQSLIGIAEEKFQFLGRGLGLDLARRRRRTGYLT